MTRLSSANVTLSYDADPIVVDLSVEIPDGEITTIIGPNGCGKSTLLRAMARLLRPNDGAVILDGQLIQQLPTREVAKRLGLLSQQMSAPDGITVEDLARRGRYPHQAFLQSPTALDADAVDRAIELAGMTDLRKRAVDELSGGQRQRAWIAMALAQETPLLLLDEPTTYLDLAHQMEVLDLVERLNREEERTIVMVLHDVNEAARISHRLVAMKNGSVVRSGHPAEVIEPKLLGDLYGVECDVLSPQLNGAAVCVPRGRVRSAQSALPHVTPAACPGIEIEHLQVCYGDTPILHDLSVTIPAGAVTAIIGPNACGKSTFLRCCASLLKPRCGAACIDCKDVQRGSRRDFARQLALLSQGPKIPPGLLVEDLVAFGRTPHQRLFRQWSNEDERAVTRALERCELTGLRTREIDSLSGGQRQRAWFAMALAQETPVLLLDEPTTFLDLGAQIDLLDLVIELNRSEGRTIAMILHDLNLAARYADWLIAMKDGQIVAEGTPNDILTPALLRDVFAVDAAITLDPVAGTPLVLPESTAGRLALAS